jgi:hypothetical protein
MMMMTIKLRPLPYNFTQKSTGRLISGFEQILLEADGSPLTMFHVDLLWNTPEHKAIHERLCAGETVEVEMTFKAVEQ